MADELSDDWRELTHGISRDGRPAVRLAASDLQRAQRGAARLRADQPGVAVILDLHVTVTADFGAVRDALAAGRGATVRYAGTVDGLAGLIADIELAGVADGVTLISEAPRQELRSVGRDVLSRLALRGRLSA